jgi:protein-S-isoprenylcysteine O-methyltransferase Ste14
VSKNSSQGQAQNATFLIVAAMRGIIRDRNTRRKTMSILLVIALIFLFFGSTFLQSALDPREHPTWFILFWLTCAWLTLTAMALAIFDLLVVRLDGRKAHRELGETFERSRSSP